MAFEEEGPFRGPSKGGTDEYPYPLKRGDIDHACVVCTDGHPIGPKVDWRCAFHRIEAFIASRLEHS